jgi:hypothetical protein
MRLRQWRDLCQERRDAQQKVDEYALFDDQGRTTPERLVEHDELMDHVRDVQRRQDEFLALSFAADSPSHNPDTI